MPAGDETYPWSVAFMKWVAGHYNVHPSVFHRAPVLRERLEEALIRHIEVRGPILRNATAVFSGDEGLMWVSRADLTKVLRGVRMTKADAIRQGLVFDGQILA